jgi:hypothetical protein
METSHSKKLLRELKQLTDYQTFIVLNSGIYILISQKNSYHRVFDVKYDLRHKARLVEGDNWTVNEKIYQLSDSKLVNLLQI